MVDTKVEGDPSSIRTAATFLDTTLKGVVDDASDDAASARRKAQASWYGDSEDSYSRIARKCVDAADEAADGLRDGGDKLRACAGKIERMQGRMLERRTRATNGGLTVVGTVIIAPPCAASPGPRPTGSDVTPEQLERWEQRDAAFDVSVARTELYNSIAKEVTDDWDDYDTWVESSLRPFATQSREPTAAAQLLEALDTSAAALVGFGIDWRTRQLQQYATDAREQGTRLRREAAQARRQRRSGNPARRAAGNAVDIPGNRRAARGLDAVADGAERLARRLPIIGGVITAGGIVSDLASGKSPSTVAVSEGAAVLGGIGGAALVVGGAALLGVGAPVIAVAAGAAIVGVGASLAAEYAWENWVPEDVRESIDEGLRDFGQGVADTAGDAWDAVTFWD